MTPEEYRKAKREVEQKDAAGGCMFAIVTFMLLPMAWATLGFVPGILITAVVSMALILGLAKWQT